MSEVNGTAEKLHRVQNARGDMAIYRLVPPYVEHRTNWADGTQIEVKHHFVAVSAVNLDLGVVIPSYRTSETMIFPSDGDDVSDWGELAMVPEKSHASALEQLGYAVSA